jgi:hypothetical protein
MRERNIRRLNTLHLAYAQLEIISILTFVPKYTSENKIEGETEIHPRRLTNPIIYKIKAADARVLAVKATQTPTFAIL